MSEQDVIDRNATPLTVASLTDQLRACGLADGQTVLVHLAIRKLGWVIGGAQDAQVRFFRQRLAVDFAVGWMETHRGLRI